MSKVILWVGLFFLPFGLLFTTLGWFGWSADQKLEAEGARAKGVVIRMVSDGQTSAPVVGWTDGRGTAHIFESRYFSSSPSVAPGDEVIIVYDPQRPEKARIDSFGSRLLLPLIFGGLGSLALLIGSGLSGAYFRHRWIINHLEKNGLRIEAQFHTSRMDRSTHVNGRHPYLVTAKAKHPRTGHMTSFKSRLIWPNLAEELNGKTVPVFVDPVKPTRHIVDLSEWLENDDYA